MDTSRSPRMLQQFPVTPGQEALWTIHQLLPDSGVYNAHMVFEVPAELDIGLLKQALQLLIERHAQLRALFGLNEDGRVVQRIHDWLPLQFDELDLGDADQDALMRIIHAQLHTPFDIEHRGTSRWVYFKRRRQPGLLMVAKHHINVDLWSLMVVMNDLEQVYGAMRRGLPMPPPANPLGFDQFVAQQQVLIDSDKGKQLAEFWREQLQGMTSLIDLPTDYPRPPVRTCNKSYHHFTLPQGDIERFLALAQKPISPFALFEALFHVLLFRYTGQQDISVGVPTAGREDDFAGVFGYFSNAVIVRAQMDGVQPFSEFLLQHNKHIGRCLKAADCPFPVVANLIADARDPSRAPLVQVCFVWENINRFENRDQPKVVITPSGHQQWALGDMGQWRRLPLVQQLDDFDLTFKVYKFKNELHFGVEYNQDLFSEPSIQRMAGHFHRLMQAVSDTPDRAICDLVLLQEYEREQLLQNWNQTSSHYPPLKFLTDFFAEHVAIRPHAVAVEFEDQRLSYADLDAQADRLASLIQQRGVRADKPIGVFLERSAAVVVSLLGILRAGAAYLPLDPSYPTDRLRFILEDAAPALIISSRSLLPKLEDNPQPPPTLIWEDQPPTTHQPVRVQLDPQQLAYIIYTSGSTGRPKGVMITHANLNHLLHTQRQIFKISPRDRVLQFASINFDASVFEMVLALQSGATLQLASKEQLFGKNLLLFLKQHKISWTLLPPALLASLTPESLPDLTTLVVGGDACSTDLAKRWSAGRRFYNAYGPTEYSVWATTTEVDGSVPPPIGKPVANTEIYILDSHLNPQPVGIPGEIHIGGAGLARGYLNRPELTSEKFIDHPFHPNSHQRLYKTGDLARYLPDGNIEFLGRLDHQVKIRGFRIELGEIESILRELASVQDVLVMAREDIGSEKVLIAYLVKADEKEDDTQTLRNYLREKLPDYMIPAAFVWLDAFPLTPNEKIDRKALPLPDLENARSSREIQAPRNEIERIIAAVWKECLGLADVSIRENFFDLGGHSLLLAKVHTKLPEFLQHKLSMVDLYKYPTIQSLANFVERDIEEDEYFVKEDAHVERMRLRRRLMASISGVKIAIVGMAGRFPGADTVQDFWQNICNKTESITFFTPEQLREAGVPEEVIRQPNYVPAKGVLRDVAGFDAAFFNFTPREAQITDPQQRLFLEVAWEALEDAGCVPARFKGRIGVYGGVGINQYLVNNLAAHPQLLASVGDYPVLLGNDKDFLCTRVSYKLNLDGPAVVVQTACSTSLVAVHTACQALLNEECDAALAGGVSLSRLGNTGYFYHEGMIMSPDGHCRAFDAKAAGTVQGQGCGIVVLKRLDDALRDNDHIYAVISGSATNNDGSNKTGYTAPSVDGQAKAIRLAQASANLSPTRISYIEAHGTGTPIGDPIEIEALKQTFRDDNSPDKVKPGLVKQRCAIGSVKTNIGHLDAAAGIAGLIKTAMAMQARLLPPTLHFERPNPKIHLSNSPFYVNTELKPWDTQGDKRYAAVSSFGMGGTNAHVILTEAPNETPTEKSRPWQLVTLSARTPSALETMTERFVEHLRRTDQHFSNICYTLHVGRALFPYRRYLVCRNPDEAIAELSPPNPQSVVTSHARAQQRKLVFMFSGQGSQYVNMGKHLYQVELSFRKTVDECRALLRQKFVHVFEELSEADSLAATDKIHQTYLTQPGLFIFEYAMAKLLMSWGITPDYLIGHSVGEYVAACLEGVFTLEQALELVAIRGQLIQQLEGGDMLSVRMSEEEALLLTNHDVSLAAVNGAKRCVLSGSRKAIQYLHEQLERRGVENRILHTSHAFHSHMMEPILERFAAYVARRKPQAPTRPFLSSLTGTWVTAEQTRSAQYWADHLRHTVRFHQGLTQLFEQRDRQDPEQTMILLEIGPGKALTTLAKQHAGKKAQDWVLATTRHAYEEVSDSQHLLRILGRLWEQGVEINWDEFHSQRQRYRVPLPTYPFERSEYWVKPKSAGLELIAADGLEEAPAPTTQPETSAAAGTAPRDEVEEVLWQAWAQCLGRDDFGVFDNFFDLGGDSLLAVSLMDQLRQAFKAPLTTPTLIQKPTIADLADHIHSHAGIGSGEDALDDSPLVMIQRGKVGHPPLVLVHPIGGEVFFYRDLARLLGNEQPVYAFQAPSLSGTEEPLHSVYALAERYLCELQKKGFKPPYLLGGSSFGGLVAYEMAQQLQRCDEEVRLLVMIDTPAPSQMPDNLTDSAAILHYLLRGKLELSLDKLRELNPQSQIDYVLEEARAHGKAQVLPPHLGIPLFKTWIAHQDATFAYKPQPYPNDIVFFRHTEPMERFPAEPHKPWLDLIEGKVEVYQVPGNHISMNSPPHVKTLAAHLKAVLRKYV